jgi:hypothetical protein
MGPMAAGLRFRVQRAAKKIPQQHRHIDELFGRLQAALTRDGLPEVKEMFLQYHGAIEANFAIEDDVFFPALHGLHPELGAELQKLCDEHRSFSKDLEDLADRLDNLHLKTFNSGLHSFIARLALHEWREERLLAPQL